MKDTVKHMLETLVSLYGVEVMADEARLKALALQLFGNTSYKKCRNLLAIALGDMQAYTRLKSLSGGEFLATETLAAEMHEDYDILLESAISVMEAIGETASSSVLRISDAAAPIIALQEETTPLPVLTVSPVLTPPPEVPALPITPTYVPPPAATFFFGKYGWYALKTDGNFTLYISEDAVAQREWGRRGVAWQNSDMRYFLNGPLLNSFSSEERSKIQRCASGDYLFLLDADEANVYFKNSESRRVRYGNHIIDWWLRPGTSNSSFANYLNLSFVNYYGMTETVRASMSDTRKPRGVRPAMWLQEQ